MSGIIQIAEALKVNTTLQSIEYATESNHPTIQLFMKRLHVSPTIQLFMKRLDVRAC